MTTDPSSTLAGIRERAQEYADAPMISAAAYASADDVPPLLATLDAVLKLHSRWEIRDDDGEGEFQYAICRHCCAGNGAGQTEECADEHAYKKCWPCPTYRAITSALSGEETGNGDT